MNAICQNFLDAARIARDVQKDRSDYTTLPKIFKVPTEAPWPEHLQGRTLFTANIRCFYKTKKIDAAIVDELNALRFVWDPQEHQRNMEFLAFSTYRAIYGDLCVPSMFVVPDLDPKWPKDTWNMHLGVITKTVRSSWKTLLETQRDSLVKLGFVWKDIQWTMDSRIAAFKWFKQVHGHITIPENFVVPSDDTTWPSNLWGIPLGVIAAEMESTVHKLQPEEFTALKELGMKFDNVDRVMWEEKVQALIIYGQIHGDLLVPSRFKVPNQDPRWHRAMWGMGLGGIVSRLRRDAKIVSRDRYNQLLKLGFVWDMDEFLWTRKLKALETYKALYGDLKIPQVFNVPMHDPKWPQETWGFKLGRSICRLREYHSALSPERVELLSKMGFIWRCRRKRQQKPDKTLAKGIKYAHV
ncbi:Aste57867_22210 [Aphanomyces stellatus]|uniref:Aste57867_22210 protein n=1 Tax=Aphanomyces stellatus TaxID=120398 RepID=A0A485LJU8_9STRA|nr:hypothetical protein As57867_022141 [Aphanomyces stellatus]VFT98877.1 Aste57867_22210 [Aphanomyces stellatus]